MPRGNRTRPAPSQQNERPSNDELVDDLLQRAGGVSTFHVLFYFAVSTSCNCVRAFVNWMIPFLIQKQIYKCALTESYDDGLRQLNELDQDSICTQENICEGDERILSWEIDYENNRSLHNWVQ